jgi:hypothetical protein
MNKTWLANFFDNNREIIESAETPFAKLSIFILPILAPSVPATMTGLHLYKLFIELFTFQHGDGVAFVLSAIISTVLELLGYVGAISFISSLFKWVKFRKDEYLLPFSLNGGAYLFYLIAMWLINIQLGKYFGTPQIVNSIFGLLSFITVPTGLLAANHLSQKAEAETETVLRNEQREYNLKKYKIKHGMNPDPVYQQATQTVSQRNHRASDYKDYVFELLNENMGELLNPDGSVSLSKITEKVNKKKRVELAHSAVKGTWYKFLQEWKRTRPQ